MSSQYLTKELAFECDPSHLFEGDIHHACLEFVRKYSGESLIQERDGNIRILTGKAGNIFETAMKTAFGTVDIKGQI